MIFFFGKPNDSKLFFIEFQFPQNIESVDLQEEVHISPVTHEISMNQMEMV